MISLSQSKGQGLLEAVLCLPLLIATGFTLTLLLYRSLVFYMAEYHLHEALICSESEQIHVCQDHLIKKLRGILPHNTALQVRMPRSIQQKSGEVNIALNPPLKVRLQLHLPSTGGFL